MNDKLRVEAIWELFCSLDDQDAKDYLATMLAQYGECHTVEDNDPEWERLRKLYES